MRRPVAAHSDGAPLLDFAFPRSSRRRGKTDRPRPDWLTPAVLVGLVRIADAAVLLAAAAAAGTVVARPPGDALPVVVLLLVVPLAINAFQIAGLYVFDRLAERDYQLTRCALAWTLVVMLLVTLGYATATLDRVPRLAAGAFYLFGLLGLGLVRLAVGFGIGRLRRAGRLVCRLVVVGAGEHGQRLVRHLRQAGEGIRLIGLFDDRRDRVPDYVAGYPVLGTVDDLREFVRRHAIDQVVVALPWGAETRIRGWLEKLAELPVDVRLCPDLPGHFAQERRVSHVAGVPLVHVFDRPLAGWNALAKAIEDRLLAALVILLAGPLMLAVALAVKLTSRGPVFYRQLRYGFNNEPIAVLKFRTMYVEHCDDGVHGGVPQARVDDPRVTPLGRILRRLSLDELPQFFNVLRGEMSIVGPRPHAVAHNELYAELIGGYLARHRVKPGITGWAQVNGLRGEIRSLEALRERVQYDLYYIENWSLLFDLRIIFRTILVGFYAPEG